MLTPNESLLCCYFPTQIVVVDDDISIADSLRFILNTKLRVFCNPSQALGVLSEYKPRITESLWLQPDHSSDLWDGVHKQPLVLNLEEISRITGIRDRYDDISVIIVDYHMPELDGLVFLSHLREKPFKKILLTGAGTTALAVDAFNEGLIDHFIRKDDENLQVKIREVVSQLKKDYFFDMCKKSIGLLREESRIFSMPEIVEFFDKKISELNITEFYLLNMGVGFLLIEKNNNKKHLAIYTKEYVERLEQYAKADNATDFVVASIRNKKSAPYFVENKAHWQIQAKDWDKYLKPLEKVINNNLSFFVSIF